MTVSKLTSWAWGAAFLLGYMSAASALPLEDVEKAKQGVGTRALAFKLDEENGTPTGCTLLFQAVGYDARGGERSVFLASGYISVDRYDTLPLELAVGVVVEDVDKLNPLATTPTYVGAVDIRDAAGLSMSYDAGAGAKPAEVTDNNDGSSATRYALCSARTSIWLTILEKSHASLHFNRPDLRGLLSRVDLDLSVSSPLDEPSVTPRTPLRDGGPRRQFAQCYIDMMRVSGASK